MSRACSITRTVHPGHPPTQCFVANVPVSHPGPRGAGWKAQIISSLPCHLRKLLTLIGPLCSAADISLCFCLMRYRRLLKLTIELPGMLDPVNLHQEPREKAVKAPGHLGSVIVTGLTVRANNTTFPLDAHPGLMSQPGSQPRLQHPPLQPCQGARTWERMHLTAGGTQTSARSQTSDLPEVDSTAFPHLNDLMENPKPFYNFLGDLSPLKHLWF